LGLLVHALHVRDWGLLAEALDDRLHQPYRLALYPWAGNALRAASDAGAYGSAIAGAGPSVFAFCAPGRGTQVAAAMADAARVNGATVAAPLVAMCLQGMGVPAVSLSGHQAGVRTTRHHSNARIRDIDPKRIRQALAEGKVPVVAGFQGVSEDLEITTLGRGGSDTTAVALAFFFDADASEIYTD